MDREAEGIWSRRRMRGRNGFGSGYWMKWVSSQRLSMNGAHVVERHDTVRHGFSDGSICWSQYGVLQPLIRLRPNFFTRCVLVHAETSDDLLAGRS